MGVDRKRVQLTPILLLCAGIVLIWAPFVVRMIKGTTALAGLLEHDIGFQWIPFKEFTRAVFAQGYFPLWCPYVFAGMPFLAFSHTQVLYPLGWVLTFFDYAKAVNFYYPLHLSLGFIGFYLLLTNLGISRFVSFLVGLSAVLSGKFFYFIHFLPIASSNFWGIWFFYFLVKLSKESRVKFLLGLSIALMLEILGGDIESTTYQLFFTPFFLTFILKQREQKIFSRVWLFLFVAILLGILLASAQFLTLFEYSGFFLRSAGYTFEGFESRALSPGLAWGIVFPLKNLKGPGLSTPAPYLYLGLIVLFFPFYSALRSQKNFGLFLLALFALLFSFGSFKALDWVIFHIPFLNRYGAQEHCFFLFQIFWSVLAGLGLEQALKENCKGVPWFFIFSMVLVLAGELYFPSLGLRKFILIFSAIAFLVFLVSRKFLSADIYRKLSLSLLLILFLLDLYFLSASMLPNNSPANYKLPAELQRFKKSSGGKGYRAVAVSRMGINDPVLLQQFGLRANLGTIDGWITTPPLDYAKFLNLLDNRSLTLKDGRIDKFGFNVHFRDGKFIQADTLPLLDILSVKYFLVREINLKFASPYSLTGFGPHFVYLEKGDWLKADLSAEAKGAGLEIKLRSDSGSALIYQRVFAEPDQALLEIDLSPYAGKNWELRISEFPPEAFAKREIIINGLRIENSSRPIQRIYKNEIEIFENREAFPEAFIVHNCRWFSGEDKILEELKKFSQWDLSEQVILSRESRFGKIVQQTWAELKANWIDPHKLKEPLSRVKENSEEIAFQAYLNYPGYLFLNHQYFPGWKAYIDGNEFPIEKANYCFRAVFLEKGLHQIEFRYEPVSFRIGLWVSLITIFSGIFFWVVLRRRFDQAGS